MIPYEQLAAALEKRAVAPAPQHDATSADATQADAGDDLTSATGTEYDIGEVLTDEELNS